jgi:hypothetical protein
MSELITDEGVAESVHEAAWKQVRAEAIRTVAELEPKRVADAFGVTDTALHHALAERNRMRLSAQQLVYLQVNSKHITLAAMVPRMLGHDVIEQRPMTPEEECQRWRSMADRMGVIGQQLKAEVYGRKVKP